jgi:hypothetical protein
MGDDQLVRQSVIGVALKVWIEEAMIMLGLQLARRF